MSENLEQESDASRKRPRKRSPKYPAYGLRDCIAKAKVIYEEEDENLVPLEAVAEHWQSKPTSSAFQQSISALKQFGLLIEEGAGANRSFRLSQLALDIAVHEEDSREYTTAIKKAALSPSIHAELWEKYKGKLPKSDASIRVFLLRERDDGRFNKSYVDAFIDQFRTTIAFAKLSDGDIINGSEDNDAEITDEQNMGVDVVDKFAGRKGSQETTGGGFSPPKAPPGTRDFPLYTSTSRGALFVPEQMTEKDFDLFELQVKNSLAVIKATGVVPNES